MRTLVFVLGLAVAAQAPNANTKITSSEVIVKTTPDNVAKLAEVGEVAKVNTSEVDEYPLPVVTLVVNGATADPKNKNTIVISDVLDDLVTANFIEAPNSAVARAYVWSVVDFSLHNRRFASGCDSSVSFAARPDSKYRLSLVVTYLYETNILRSAQFYVDIVRGNAPDPNTPDEPVKPVIPVDKFGLGQKTYDDINKLVTVQKVEGAKAFSTALTQVVADIDAGKYKDIGNEVLSQPDGANKKVSLQLNAVLSSLTPPDATQVGILQKAFNDAKVDKSNWSAFGQSLMKNWFGLYNGKQLLSLDDIRIMIDATNNGAKAIR